MHRNDTRQAPSEALLETEDPSSAPPSRAPSQPRPAWLSGEVESPASALPAWARAKIEAAIQRHLLRFSEAQIQAFRDQVAWTLATHPALRDLVQAADSGRLS